MFKFSELSQIWKKYIQKLNDWDLPLTDIYDTFVKTIDNGEEVRVVFIDMFDTYRHIDWCLYHAGYSEARDDEQYKERCSSARRHYQRRVVLMRSYTQMW